MEKVICLDAGHGGADPGAIGRSGTKEKDIALIVTQKVRDILVEDHNVLLTRTGDCYLNLTERGLIANSMSADIFVSIHCNAFADKGVKGIETYHYPTSTLGRLLALEIQRALISVTDTIDRGVKTADFQVLRETQMPAALVELGFLTNEKEEKLLSTEKYQDTLAKAIAHGIKEYLLR